MAGGVEALWRVGKRKMSSRSGGEAENGRVTHTVFPRVRIRKKLS
jgi:hypothetical protein